MLFVPGDFISWHIGDASFFFRQNVNVHILNCHFVWCKFWLTSRNRLTTRNLTWITTLLWFLNLPYFSLHFVPYLHYVPILTFIVLIHLLNTKSYYNAHLKHGTHPISDLDCQMNAKFLRISWKSQHVRVMLLP